MPSFVRGYLVKILGIEAYSLKNLIVHYFTRPEQTSTRIQLI